jgi:hypothetical protein
MKEHPMPEELLFDRERAALAELLRLVEERRDAEVDQTTTHVRAKESALEDGERIHKELAAGRETDLLALDAAFEQQQQELTRRFEEQEAAAQRALIDNRRRIDSDEQETREKLETQLKDTLWTADSLLEGGLKRVKEQRETIERKVASAEEQAASLWRDLTPLLARVGLTREDVEPERGLAPASGHTLRDLNGLMSKADQLVRQIQAMRLRWITWPTLFGLTVVTMALACLPALWMRPWVLWLTGGLSAGGVLPLLFWMIARGLAIRRVEDTASEIAVLLIQGRDLGAELVGQAGVASAGDQSEVQQKHRAERQKIRARFLPLIEQVGQRCEAERAALGQQHQAAEQARRQYARQTVEESGQRYQQARATCLADYKRRLLEAETTHAERLRTVQRDRLQSLRQTRERWLAESTRLVETFSALQQSREPLGMASATPTGAAPGVVELPFGTLTVDLHTLAGDLAAEQLAPLPDTTLALPAFLPFPRRGGVLLHACNQGRAAAVQGLQALMLRFLTAVPPGKVRFTILDPVGLGDNFAAFMHLADHDELLVSSRIWTEPEHIEKQLADLTGHMETVIQKYLRSQFSSIEEYNEAAGEVAEPYRVLVVANFPVNFTADAARRLVSIVQSGASCGVYAFISADIRQALPHGFQLDDLEQQCLNLVWREAGAEPGTWRVAAGAVPAGVGGSRQSREIEGIAPLDRFPLALESPPDADTVIQMVQRIGAQSREASRVQVPFSFLAPSEDQVWRSDSRRGLTVPLGRAGAVRRLALQLGKGTAQHVLVAGKTGSGKSTLLHALITNLALHYSPTEVELFLVDFKKGVEFKMYAECDLPHARVIAIESEREFGLSVLQRLDAELRERGDRFRAAGVNDIAGYRDAHPEAHCPRVLLIVDEFQEFFIEDDRLSQEAALLLDRLVRQGRAFGLHVLLGSQTLGGAYSLARSTIDQMAVRIALQCSDADAQLILNKDNGAARLLTRPGEAIYNDANGGIEGNEIFQVVWLPEDERERILHSLHQRARKLALRKPLVFEGNTPAELDRNPVLERVLATGTTGERGHRAWLGDAIAIKDPTAAVFRPQTGTNLLIVGQNDEAALAILASALVSLAVQQPTACFHVLDGTGVDEPQHGFLKEAITGWPHRMELVERAALAASLAPLADEMNQRLKGTSRERAVHYLFIHGLQRFREFRRSDDDLGFGRRGADRTVSPLEHLQALLRDGPGVGIHVLLWCDSLTNVTRTLDRQGLRECGLRVLFQMSAADSSHLLDSPLASKLGRNRALFFHDEMAQPEKFRPYGLPSLSWLTEVKHRVLSSALVATKPAVAGRS